MYDIPLDLKPNIPEFFICKPDKTTIGKLNNIKPNHEINLGSLNEINFTMMYVVEDNKGRTINNPNIEKIKDRYIIKVVVDELEEYYIINEIRERSNSSGDFKEVHAFSLGYELNDKRLRRYEGSSLNCTEVSTEALSQTLWSVGHVDSQFDIKFRQFETDEQTVLNFIFEIAETFGAVVTFDTVNRKVNFYKHDNIGNNNGLRIGYGKYLKDINRNSNSDEMVTRLSVFGNEGMSINRVNPTGSNYIESFDYFIYPFKRETYESDESKIDLDYFSRYYFNSKAIVRDPLDQIYEDSGLPNPPLGAVFNNYDDNNGLLRNSISSVPSAWALLNMAKLYRETKNQEAYETLVLISDFFVNNMIVGDFYSTPFVAFPNDARWNSENGWEFRLGQINLRTFYLVSWALFEAFDITKNSVYSDNAKDLLDSTALFNRNVRERSNTEISSFMSGASYDYIINTSDNSYAPNWRIFSNGVIDVMHHAITKHNELFGDQERNDSAGEPYVVSEILERHKQFIKYAYDNLDFIMPISGMPYGFFKYEYSDETNSEDKYVPEATNWNWIDNKWGKEEWFSGDLQLWIINGMASSGLTAEAEDLYNKFYNLKIDNPENEILFYDRYSYDGNSIYDKSIAISFTALLFNIADILGIDNHRKDFLDTILKYQIDSDNPEVDGAYKWNVEKELDFEHYTEVKTLGEVIHSPIESVEKIKNRTIKHSDYLSDELCHAILDYDNKLESSRGEFSNLLDEKKALEDSLSPLENEYFSLIVEYDIILDELDVSNATNEDGNNDDLIEKLVADKEAKEKEIDSKDDEIDEVYSNIDLVDSDIDDLKDSLAIENNFTQSQIQERNQFIIQKSWSDDNYIDDEELYEAGKDQFDKMRVPKTTVDINIVNFKEVISEYKNWDKLNIGDTIYIHHEKLNLDVKAKITKISFDYEERNVNIEISDVYDIKNEEDEFISKLNKSYSTSMSVDMSKHKWNETSRNMGEINKVIDNQWDANKNRIVAGVNESVDISKRGIQIKNPEFPNDLLVANSGIIGVSNDGGSTFKNAITTSGVVGERVFGKIIAGVNLSIENDSGKFTFNDQGVRIEGTSLTITKGLPEDQIDSDATKRWNSSESNAISYTEGQIKEVREVTDSLDGDIKDFSSDGKLTLAEANSLKSTLKQMKKESLDVINIGIALELNEHANNYQNAINTLETELTNYWIDQPSYPLDISLSNRDLIVQELEDVQDKKSILINKITKKREDNAISYTESQIKEVNEITDSLDGDIKDFSSDEKLTLAEANSLKSTLKQVEKESLDLINIGISLDLNEHANNYQNALDELRLELEANWIDQPSYPLDISLANRDLIHLELEDVQEKKSILINKISEKREDNAISYTESQIKEVNKATKSLNDDINEFSSDGKITLAESKALKIGLRQLDKESTDVINIANSLNIVTEKNNYSDALSELSVTVNNWIDRSDYPVDISSLQRNEIEEKFENVQDAKSKLINEISKIREERAKDYAIGEGESYNGVVFSHENGVVVNKSDGLVRSMFNATDGIRIQTKEDTLWRDKFYYDVDSSSLVVDGKINARDLIVGGESVLTTNNKIDSKHIDNLTASSIVVGDKTLDDELNEIETEFSSIDGELSSIITKNDDHETRIKQTEDDIDLRVEKGDIINSINISEEGISIKSKHIDLVGAVTVLSDITGELGSITAGSIDIGNGTFVVDSSGNLTANSGTFRGNISGGSITSNTSVDISEDINIGKNINMLNDYDDRFVEKFINFNSGSTSYSSHIAGTYLKLEMVCKNAVRLKSDIIDLEGGIRHGSGTFNFNSNQPRQSVSEKGFCGIGGTGGNFDKASNMVGVNFKVSKHSTPSSISFETVDGNREPNHTNINRHGFLLYIEGEGVTGLVYWRGYYTA